MDPAYKYNCNDEWNTTSAEYLAAFAAAVVPATDYIVDIGPDSDVPSNQLRLSLLPQKSLQFQPVSEDGLIGAIFVFDWKAATCSPFEHTFHFHKRILNEDLIETVVLCRSAADGKVVILMQAVKGVDRIENTNEAPMSLPLAHFKWSLKCFI